MEIEELQNKLKNTQHFLQESQNQEMLEKLRNQAFEIQTKEMAQWEKEKFELLKLKFNEFKQEKENEISELKNEIDDHQILIKNLNDKNKSIQKVN